MKSITTMKDRRSIRLRDYDYSKAGAYFVTVCTRGGEAWFGEILADKTVLSPEGHVVHSEWSRLTERFEGMKLDAFIVMPNHLHGIVVLERKELTPGPTLGALVRAFKACSARRIRHSGKSEFAWQRNYYEHVIRNASALDRIRRYILTNPGRWDMDRENPQRSSEDEFDQWISGDR